MVLIFRNRYALTCLLSIAFVFCDFVMASSEEESDELVCSSEKNRSGAKLSSDPEQPKPDSKQEKPFILVIEANSLNRTIFASVLSRACLNLDEFAVEYAKTGEKAVELHQQLHPVLTFVDYTLPGINGAEVIRRMKKNCADSKLPYEIGYLVGCSSTNEDNDKMKDEGTDHSMIKPFDVADMQSALSVLTQNDDDLYSQTTEDLLQDHDSNELLSDDDEE